MLGLVPASALRAFHEPERIEVTGRGRRSDVASVERLREFVRGA